MRIRKPSVCIANGVYRSTGISSMETDAAGVGTGEPDAAGVGTGESAPDIIVPPAEVGGVLGLDR
jgi:hypothetical protein